MGILQRIYRFFTTASYKRTRSALILLTLAAAIPFTVYVAGQEQDIRQYASIIPPPTQPILPAFKKAIRFSSKFIIPTSTQKLSGSKPGTLVRSEGWTIEGFVRVSQSLSGTPKKGKMNLLSLTQNKTATLKENIASLYIDVEKDGTFKPYAAVLTKTNPQIIIGGKNNIYLKPDRWYHLAGEFEYLYDTKQCYYSLWIDGKLVEGKMYDVVDTCPIRLPDPQSVVIGGEIPFPLPTITPLPNITLDVDEVRVSGGEPRYIIYFLSGLNFSRPTEPFIKDPYTALLWHFDDNFKDEGYYRYDLNFLSGVVDFIDANIPQIGIPETKIPKCAQVLTPARNPLTGECKTFPNSCIPSGWVRVASCTSQ